MSLEENEVVQWVELVERISQWGEESRGKRMSKSKELEKRQRI